MFKRKGIQWAIIVSIALLLLLTACSSGKKSENGDATSQPSTAPATDSATPAAPASNLSAPGTFPIAITPEKLSVYLGKISWITDYVNNAATKWLEKKTNIQLNFEFGPESGEELKQKVNLLLASGSKLPDVFLGSVPSVQVSTYGQQGLFLPLNDYIEKYGVNTKKLLQKYPNLLKSITATDGKIYALPQVIECMHCMYSQRFWINQKWLDAVHMKMPETPDDMYNVLKAFKGKDLNGNGKQDEIPLLSVIDGWGEVTGFLMNPFVQSTGKGYQWTYVEGGKLIASYMQDGWKEGLRFLKKLYDENLLDHEAFSLKTEQAKVLFGGTEGNRIGALDSGALSVNMDISSPGPRDDFVVVPPLKNAKGERTTPWYSPTGNPYFVISKDAANPELAFRLGDALAVDYAKETEWRDFFYGPKGSTWDVPAQGVKGLNGEQALWHQTYVWGQPTDQFWASQGILYASADDKGTLAVSSDGSYNQETSLWNAAVNVYKPYAVDNVPPPIAYTVEEAAAMAEPRTQLVAFVDQSVMEFVTGKKDLDKDWDAYKDNVKKLGFDNYMTTMQAAYDRQYK